MRKTLIIVAIILGAIALLIILNRKFKFWDKMSRPEDSGIKKYNFFKLSEFDSPAEFPSDSGKPTYTHGGVVYLTGSGEENMKDSVMTMLEAARLDIERGWNTANPLKKIVFRINSGYRTPVHNVAVGGVTNSEHIDGQAGDISTSGYNIEQKQAMLKALYLAGFRRFGIGRNIVHADNDTGKPTPAVWNYGSGYELAHWEIENIKALTA